MLLTYQQILQLGLEFGGTSQKNPPNQYTRFFRQSNTKICEVFAELFCLIGYRSEVSRGIYVLESRNFHVLR